ncbi:MAG: substrate-binding domain-containing protein [Phycisphaerae bacterium]
MHPTHGKTSHKPLQTIALLLPMGDSFGRDVFMGISSYGKLHSRWQLALHEPLVTNTSRRIMSRADGIIATVSHRHLAETLQEEGLPVVNITARKAGGAYPTVCVDNRSIGRTAAEHFLDKHLQHFATFGSSHEYRVDRLESFARYLEAKGYTVQRGPGHQGSPYELEQLPQWLADLPKPCGILCFNDRRAGDLLRHIEKTELNVPNDLAVLGVDNDEISLAMASVPLSSVRLDGRRIGQLAAEMLEKLIGGLPASDEPVLVPPPGVEQRASTDLFALDDPDTVRALEFIQRHATRPVSVGDVAEECGIPRRSLERRFREQVGRTVRKQILHVQLQRARQLLLETGWSVARIARASGLGRPEHLSRIFRREMGTTPRLYRDEHSSRA